MTQVWECVRACMCVCYAIVILIQGPMGHTCSHFWQMVWEQNCAGIVMLNRCVEKGMVRTNTELFTQMPL